MHWKSPTAPSSCLNTASNLLAATYQHQRTEHNHNGTRIVVYKVKDFNCEAPWNVARGNRVLGFTVGMRRETFAGGAAPTLLRARGADLLSSKQNDTCGIRTHAGRPHRLSRPTP